MKSAGKKDGDQMKITREKLVEIIKEEIAGLDEGIFDAFKAAARTSTRGGYKSAGERGAESKEVASDRIDDEIRKLSSKGRHIASVATMDANLHSDQRDAKQDKTIQTLADRSESIYDILDDPEKIADQLKDNQPFINVMRSKIASGNLFKTTFLPRILDAIRDSNRSDQNKQFFDDALIDFLDDPKMINKIANKINQLKHKSGE